MSNTAQAASPPPPPASPPPSGPAPSIELEKFKEKMGFAKFFLGTFLLGLISVLATQTIKQQEVSLKEREVAIKHEEVLIQREKAKQELQKIEQDFLVKVAEQTHSDKTFQTRRAMAQMMSHVSQSDESKQNWRNYLKAIESDITTFKKTKEEKETLEKKLTEINSAIVEKNMQVAELQSQITVLKKTEQRSSLQDKRISELTKELEAAQAASNEAVEHIVSLEKVFEQKSLEVLKLGEEVGAPALDGTIRTASHLVENADLSNKSIEGVYRKRIHMPGINFSGATLNGVGFAESKMTKANFASATVKFANLSETDLKMADFQKAKLINVDFSEADLRGANFTGATFRTDTQDTSRRIHEFSSFREADLRGVTGLKCEDLRDYQRYEDAIVDENTKCLD